MQPGRPVGVPSNISLTQEQSDILDAVRLKQNVIISSDAGCAKTTTALLIAANLPDRQVLMLTYGRPITNDTNRQIHTWQLRNVVCRTYHEQAGLCSLPRRVVNDDAKLLDLTHEWQNGHAINHISGYDIIVMDETQDMRPSHHAAMLFMLGKKHIQNACILLDPDQQIKGNDAFDAASVKFGLYADRHFDRLFQCESWIRHCLSQTFRLTENMVTFLNFVWGKNMSSRNRQSNLPVEYWFFDPYCARFAHELSSLFIEYEHSPCDLHIISLCTVRKSKPLQHIAQQISRVCCTQKTRRFNLRINDSNTSAHNCFQFRTCDAAKGSTVNTVLVFGFNSFRHDRTELNKLCVAASRANYRLILVHNVYKYTRNNGQYMAQIEPFLSGLTMDRIKDFEQRSILKLVNCPRHWKVRDAMPEELDTIGVCDLIEHLNASVCRSLLSTGNVVCIPTPSQNTLCFDTTAQFCTGALPTTESVSALYGMSIPYALELHKTGKIGALQHMQKHIIVDTVLGDCVLYDSFVGTVSEHVFLSAESTELLKQFFGTSHRMPFQRAKKFCKLLPEDVYNRICTRQAYQHYFALYKEDLTRLMLRPTCQWTAVDFVAIANAKLAFDSHEEAHALQRGGTALHWVQEKLFHQAVCLAQQHIQQENDCTFEQPRIHRFDTPFKTYNRIYLGIRGDIDMTCPTRDYEFKCVRELTPSMHLQAVVYSALHACQMGESRVVRLINILSGEVYEHSIDPTNAHTLIKNLIQCKFPGGNWVNV